MSFSSQYNGGKQAIKRQKVALLMRLRQNFLLKLISLASSILLYFYVQQERNPTVTRSFTAPIAYEGLRPDIEVESEQRQYDVAVTGPRLIIDALKDSDIRILADLNAPPPTKVTTEKVRLHYDINLRPELRRELTLDPPVLPPLQIQIYPQSSVDFKVTAHFSKETHVGYRYGAPVIKPTHVRVSGRADRVDRVDQVVVDANPIEPGAGIDGEFPLSPRDSANNPVEGVTLSPPKTHVAIPLIDVPYAKIVSVSPSIPDQPQPAYRLGNVVVEPNQVRLEGRPAVIDAISTLTTGTISLHDMTADQTVRVRLNAPASVRVTDLNGAPISEVTVRISIIKVDSTTTPPPSSGASGAPTTNPLAPRTGGGG